MKIIIGIRGGKPKADKQQLTLGNFFIHSHLFFVGALTWP